MGFLQSLPLPASSRSAEPLEIEGFTVKMKISLQIILADARSPGRGLPPQPFDRRISGELPNPDNIIQESESQYSDSARADTIQLPRSRRSAGSAPALSARGLGFEVPPLRVGSAEVRPSGAPRSGVPLAVPLSQVVKSPQRPAHRARFPALRPP